MATPEPIVIKITGENLAGPALNKATEGLKKTARASKSLGDRLKNLVVVWTGVKRAMQSVTGGFDNVLKATERQANAEVKLATALRRQGLDIVENQKRLVEWSRRRQDLTTWADEVTLEFAALSLDLGVHVRDIIKTVEGAQDKATQIGRAPLELMRQIARFGGGIAASLLEAGIRIDPVLTRSENWNRALKEMNTGLSELIAKLPSSAWTMFGNTLQRLRENIGAVVVSTRTFQSVLKFITDLAVKLDAALKDKTTFEEYANAIDETVVWVANKVRWMAGQVVVGAAHILRAFELITEALTFGKMRSQAEARLKRLGEQLQNLRLEMDDLRRSQGENAPGMATLIDRFHGLQTALRTTRLELEPLSQGLFDLAARLLKPLAKEEFFSVKDLKPLPSRIEQIIAALPAFDMPLPNMREFFQKFGRGFEQFLTDIQARGVEMAESFTSAFQSFAVDSFDSDVGLREAIDRLGKDSKKILIGHMAGSALDPIKESFRQLGASLAAPFNIIGNMINNVMSRISQAIGVYINQALEWLLGFVLESSVIASLMGKKAVAETTAEALATKIAWAPAAVAASIATIGRAAIVGTSLALGAINSAAGMVAAPAAEEGGIVRPRPGFGGVMTVVAEKQPEVIIPLDKMRSMFGQQDQGPRLALSIENLTFGEGATTAMFDEFVDRLEQRLREGV